MNSFKDSYNFKIVNGELFFIRTGNLWTDHVLHNNLVDDILYYEQFNCPVETIKQVDKNKNISLLRFNLEYNDEDYNISNYKISYMSRTKDERRSKIRKYNNKKYKVKRICKSDDVISEYKILEKVENEYKPILKKEEYIHGEEYIHDMYYEVYLPRMKELQDEYRYFSYEDEYEYEYEDEYEN